MVVHISHSQLMLYAHVIELYQKWQLADGWFSLRLEFYAFDYQLRLV